MSFVSNETSVVLFRAENSRTLTTRFKLILALQMIYAIMELVAGLYTQCLIDFFCVGLGYMAVRKDYGTSISQVLCYSSTCCFDF